MCFLFSKPTPMQSVVPMNDFNIRGPAIHLTEKRSLDIRNLQSLKIMVCVASS